MSRGLLFCFGSSRLEVVIATRTRFNNLESSPLRTCRVAMLDNNKSFLKLYVCQVN